MRLHEEGRHAEAIESWKEAMAEHHRAGACAYNIACAHARMQQSAEALASLERAIAAGFDVSEYVHEDADLASLRGNAAFEALRDMHGDPKSADRVRKALEALESASRTDARAAYNLACSRALDGRRDEALRELERSIELGYSDADHADEDSDLASLRGTEAFSRLLDEMRSVQLPTRGRWLGRELSADQEEWSAARDRHRKYLLRHAESGHAWSNLGYIQLMLDAPDAALVAYARAQELGHAPGRTAYNLACCHARAGHVDAAFEALALASERGFEMGGYLSSDDDLASLRGDQRFAELQLKHPSVSRRIHGHLMEHFRSLTAL
jgi:tetratricopeptide (TPR) repeat protein